jgi:hypothetical protein
MGAYLGWRSIEGADTNICLSWPHASNLHTDVTNSILSPNVVAICPYSALFWIALPCFPVQYRPQPFLNDICHVHINKGLDISGLDISGLDISGLGRDHCTSGLGNIRTYLNTNTNAVQ